MPDEIPKQAYGTFSGNINQESAHRIMHNINIAINGGTETVHMLLQSCGGCVEDAISLYNYLKSAPVEIVMYNTGGVQSAATTVFLAGNTRKASANAIFMIHPAFITLSQVCNSDLLRERADYLDITDNNTNNLLRVHINMPESEWQIVSHRPVYINAQTALMYGLIHEIADFAPPNGSRMFTF